MKRLKKKTVDVLAEIICDICGGSCSCENFGHEYASIEALWGYGSSMDGKEYEIHLCELCFKSTIKYLKEKRCSFSHCDANLNGYYALDGK
jgi:hypothetical protein